MVSIVDGDKSTVNILMSIGDRSCLQNHFPNSGFKQEGRCLDDSKSGFQCTPHRFMARLQYLRERPQGPPLFSSASSSSSHGYLVLGLKMH
jgi:hypothetical protein